MFSAIMILMLCCVVLGMAYVFYGEKNFLVLSSVSGFVFSTVIAFIVLYAKYSLMTSLIIGILIGTAVSLGMFFLKTAVRVVIGMFCGMIVGYVVLLFVKIDSRLVLPVIAICGAAVAVLTVLKKSVFTAISTSVFGAGLFTANFILLVFDYDRLYYGLANATEDTLMKYMDVITQSTKSNIWVFSGVCVLLITAGILVQLFGLPKVSVKTRSTKKRRG